MITVEDPRGHVVVLQADHAAMTADLGRAWGNELFGPVEPRDTVVLAAAEHELAWAGWDAEPALDPATGLPYNPKDLDLDVHLPMQLGGPRRLADRDPYAGVLALRKHAAKYERPSRLGRLRPRGRRVEAYLDEAARLDAELRLRVRAPDAELERNWRLVHAWDALSHDLMFGRSPRTHRVPAADGDLDLRLTRRDSAFVLDPWPFGEPALRIELPGRLLTTTFSDDAALRAALGAAPPATLVYELEPAR
jgi:hypothetical protein